MSKPPPLIYGKSPGRSPEGSLQSQALRLMAYRMVVILTIFLSTLGIQGFLGGTDYLKPFYYFIAFALVLNLLHAVLYALLRNRLQITILIYIQLLGDILSVTLLAFLTGGITSIFTLLYQIIIVVGGVILKKHGAFLVASLDAVFFGILCLVLSYNVTSPIKFGVEFPYTQPSLDSALHVLAAHYVGFLLIAVLMAIMAGKMESTKEALGVARKDLSFTRMFAEQLTDSLAWGVMRTGVTGEVTFSNPAAMALLGKEIPYGWDFSARLSELGYDGPPFFGEDSKVEKTIELSLPGDRSLLIEMAPLKSNETLEGYLLLVRDQTEMIRLRKELALKDRLAATGSMATDIAHEIKNPLGSISGAAQMLQRDGNRNAPGRELLEIIQTESDRLSGILNNLLGYVKPSPLRKADTDLAVLTGEVVTLFSRDPGGEANIKVISSIPDTQIIAPVDGPKVKQALWNLLTNAAKAVKKEGLIRVTLRESESLVFLEVEDNGIGMTPSEVTNFMQPFSHGFERGTGLGLPMVYRTMEMHGGKLEIESALGEGTLTRLIFARKESNE